MIDDTYCLFVCLLITVLPTCSCRRTFSKTFWRHTISLLKILKWVVFWMYICVLESFISREWEEFLKNLKSTIHNFQSFSIRTKNQKNFKKVAFPLKHIHIKPFWKFWVLPTKKTIYRIAPMTSYRFSQFILPHY